MSAVPAMRIRQVNAAPVRGDGGFVLYWMTANRRVRWNHALDRALEWARELSRPLVILEAVRVDYPWAAHRHHRFVVQGMADNAGRLDSAPVTYFPYVEPAAGKGRGLLRALAREACVVVGDDYPAFFYPAMLASAARQVPVRLEVVDSAGVVPMAAADRIFTAAHHFRRFAHKGMLDHLADAPRAEPLRRLDLPRLRRLPPAIASRWPAFDPAAADLDAVVRGLPIDQAVGPAPVEGGAAAAGRALRRFVRDRLSGYGAGRNAPEEDATSRLSPYLHFGHLSAHEVAMAVLRAEGWTPQRVRPDLVGRRSGWYGVGESAEAFLDELITWREVGFNMCHLEPRYDAYESLPEWARDTLAAHAGDRRSEVYTLAQFEAAETQDPLWNAAQRQLTREGGIHGYLRMLWGKKILEWTRRPQEALRVMVELNNTYALDGRDPNSYSGIFWVLGRYDRPWAPERPVFGRVRYMSSRNTAKKFRVQGYIERYGPA